MKLLILSSLLISLCSVAFADTDLDHKGRALNCASKDAKMNYAVQIDASMSKGAVFVKTGKKMDRKGSLTCMKADESTDGSSRMRAYECRDPKRMDAGYLATIYKVDETYQVELSTASFAGPHLLGLLICD